MQPPRYAEAIDDALDRMWEVGFEFGPDFAVHAPMAAETLITLGHPDVVPSWLELNRRQRRYTAPPAAAEPIPDDDPGAQRLALGDYRRVADWVAFFDRRLDTAPWQEVVVRWWPVLLDGAFAAFTHGLIRTAHAVRILRTTPEPSPLQLNELARGLAYWAARHTPIMTGDADERTSAPAERDVQVALSDLTVASAGKYATLAPRPPVPLVHAITAPAAMRLVLPILPGELRLRTCEVAERLVEMVWNRIPGFPSGRGPAREPGYRPPTGEHLTEEAVQIGDEHAIKLAEACVREYALRPDDRYLAAAHTLNISCRYEGGL
ncbi:DUF4243 domain-containing protein [Actinomadura alba]|uniref:DUF4243 domain-containing protein n=1 Tax=Actinomadura alba TaxID=406431 RepID=A0ABR7LV41_9ACTN|nr:DUF4243 domain-containing protein [Actinomadura alba]